MNCDVRRPCGSVDQEFQYSSKSVKLALERHIACSKELRDRIRAKRRME